MSDCKQTFNRWQRGYQVLNADLQHQRSWMGPLPADLIGMPTKSSKCRQRYHFGGMMDSMGQR